MSKPMNLLFLAWNYPPAIGGIESVAVNLRHGLLELGHKVFTVARHAEGEERDTDIVRPKKPGLVAYLRFAYAVSMRHLRENQVDAIVCSGISCAPAAWLLRLRCKTPYVLLAHGSDVEHSGLIYRIVMKFLFRRADAIPANSGNTKILLQEIGCESRRLRVIHPGVDASGFPPPEPGSISLAKKAQGLEGKRVLMTSGRLIRRKGVPEFVEEVMPALIKRFPDLVFVVAGGDATASLSHAERLLEPLRARVAELGLEAYVKLPGRVSDKDLMELYYASDVFVMPVIPVAGDVEGFGIVFLEAVLAGTPAVASRIGGIPEAVEDGVSGVLVEPANWDEYIKEIGALLENPDRMVEMGRVGRERVLGRFTWKIICAEYADFIREVTRGTSL